MTWKWFGCSSERAPNQTTSPRTVGTCCSVQKPQKQLRVYLGSLRSAPWHGRNELEECAVARRSIRGRHGRAALFYATEETVVILVRSGIFALLHVAPTLVIASLLRELLQNVDEYSDSELQKAAAKCDHFDMYRHYMESGTCLSGIYCYI